MIRSIVPALVLVLLCAFPAGAAALDAIETRFCTIESAEGDRTARFLAGQADALVERVSTQLGIEPRGRLRIIIASDKERFHAVQPEGAAVPEWAAGIAWPGRNLIVLRKNAGGDILQTFEHEVCHILLGQAFGPDHRVPRWLEEGLAIMIAGQWSLQRMSTMSMAVLTGRVLPMDALARGFPADAERAEIAYCQSFYFISFLKNRFGDDDFRTFLRQYAAHRDFEQALWKSYYLRWDELEGMWLDFLKVRFGWLPLLSSTGTLWFCASLVFVWAYIRKKRAAREKLRQWEREETGSFDGTGGPMTFH
jgi:hypothetical protein